MQVCRAGCLPCWVVGVDVCYCKLAPAGMLLTVLCSNPSAGPAGPEPPARVNNASAGPQVHRNLQFSPALLPVQSLGETRVALSLESMILL